MYIRKENVGNSYNGKTLMLAFKHLHPEMPSYPILPSQKTTLSIIQYHFTIHPTSQLLFYHTTH